MDFNPTDLQNLLDEDLALRSDPASKLLKQNLFSKWKFSSTEASDRALQLFKQMNLRCRDSFDLSRNADFVNFAKAKTWSHFFDRDLLDSCLDLRRCFDVGRTGPGSSRSTKHTDFFQKMFRGPMSTESLDLYFLYKYTISNRWRKAELNRSKLFKVDVVEGSKLSLVPKTSKIARTICTEPSLNMFAQLGAGLLIEKVLLRYYGINLSTQPDLNRGLAKHGSVSGDYATIDLSSASDTISIDLVKAIFPPKVFSTLDLIRSKCVELPGGEMVNLNMFSTMGNGFTFPLQTYIFALISEYVMSVSGHYSKVNVFGDDIICSSKNYDLMTSTLAQLGFIVNSGKSFNEGPFRESCGHDYHSGVNIRSVYIKELRNDQELTSAVNRLLRWSAIHRTPLPRIIGFLWKSIGRKLFVPLHESDISGIKCPSRFLEGTRRFSRNGSEIYKIYHPIERRVDLKRYVSLFEDGFIIASINGYIRMGKATLRVNESDKLYKVISRSTPYWDYAQDAGLTPRDYEDSWYQNVYSLFFRDHSYP